MDYRDELTKAIQGIGVYAQQAMAPAATHELMIPPGGIVELATTLPGYFIFTDEANMWQAMQVAPSGYEGISGGKPVDGPDYVAIGEAQVAFAVERQRDMVRGMQMGDAIAAVHRQHSYDGRPARFIPESE